MCKFNTFTTPPQKKNWLNLQDQNLLHGSWISDTNLSSQEGDLKEKVTTQAIAQLLTKISPQGCKSEQGCTISLGDQANGDPEQDDTRVDKRFW
jgi:hypothetical protein